MRRVRPSLPLSPLAVAAGVAMRKWDSVVYIRIRMESACGYVFHAAFQTTRKTLGLNSSRNTAGTAIHTWCAVPIPASSAVSASVPKEVDRLKRLWCLGRSSGFRPSCLRLLVAWQVHFTQYTSNISVCKPIIAVQKTANKVDMLCGPCRQT